MVNQKYTVNDTIHSSKFYDVTNNGLFFKYLDLHDFIILYH